MDKQKDYKDILSEVFKDLDTATGEDNRKRMGIGKALAALTMVIGDIGYKIDKMNGHFDKTQGQLDTLNKNLSDFNKNSGRLQKWLIFWTATIAMATVVALFSRP